MKTISFFHLGDAYIAAKVFGKKFGLNVLDLPKPNQATVSKGISMSPEFACFPFKVILGSYADALDRGADVLMTTAGTSITSCQVADYAFAQKNILKRNGYKFEMITIEGYSPKIMQKNFKPICPNLSLTQISEAVVLFSQKMLILEDIDVCYRNIYITAQKKEAEKFRKKWLYHLDKTDSIIDLYMMSNKIKNEFQKYPSIDTDLPRIAVIGDIHSINEDYINNKIFERLMDLKTIPEKSIHTSFLIKDKFGINIEDSILKQKTKKFLKHNIGGYAQHTLVKAIKYAEEGYDGLIHIYPFNCMPETVIRSILPSIADEYHIPILYLPIDEQTGDAGFTTRIEAFVDLIKMKRARK